MMCEETEVASDDKMIFFSPLFFVTCPGKHKKVKSRKTSAKNGKVSSTGVKRRKRKVRRNKSRRRMVSLLSTSNIYICDFKHSSFSFQQWKFLL